MDPNGRAQRTVFMRLTLLAAFAAVALVAGAALITGGSAVAAEEPAHIIDVKDGSFEVRSYGPIVIAETRVDGSRDRASNGGFQRLAGYIFGGNQSRDRFAMTAPVVQQPAAKGERFAMTAPVTEAPAGSGWLIQFAMPEGSQLARMPVPNDPSVSLREQPSRRVAVVRFSGNAPPATLSQKTEELRRWMAQRSLVAAGEPEFAFYDPPWTLPPFRRNEVIIPLQ